MTQTDPSSEVIVLDSGGYGTVSIAQSVSIIAPTGVYRGISVFAPDNGVVVDGAKIEVVLRGLAINGQGGVHGIEFLNGKSLSISNCVVSGMTQNGLEATAAKASVYVVDSEFSRNKMQGVHFGAALTAVIDRVRSEANGGNGISLEFDPTVSVSNSILARNGSNGVIGNSMAATTTLSVSDTVVTGNASYGVVGQNSNLLAGTMLLTVERATVTDKRRRDPYRRRVGCARHGLGQHSHR